MRALEYFHADLGLVDDQIDVFLRTGEVGVEIDDVGVEAGEHEPAIGVDPRWFGESRPLEVFTVCLIAGHRHLLAGGVEGPPVIKAGHEACVALWLATDHRAAVRARVQPDADYALAVTGEDDGPASQCSGLEAVGLLSSDSWPT